MDHYLSYIGGPAGALALTCVAAGSAIYIANRPVPQRPLVPLDRQSTLLPVSYTSRYFIIIIVFKNLLLDFDYN